MRRAPPTIVGRNVCGMGWANFIGERLSLRAWERGVNVRKCGAQCASVLSRTRGRVLRKCNSVPEAASAVLTHSRVRPARWRRSRRGRTLAGVSSPTARHDSPHPRRAHRGRTGRRTVAHGRTGTVVRDRRDLQQRRRLGAVRRAARDAGPERADRVHRTRAHRHTRRRHEDLHVPAQPALGRDRQRARAGGQRRLPGARARRDRLHDPRPLRAGRRRHAGVRRRGFAHVRVAAHRRRARTLPQRHARAEPRDEPRRPQRFGHRAADHRRRVLQREPRPLLREPARARHRRARHRPLPRVGAYRPHVRRMAHRGCRRSRREPGVPLLHPAAEGRLALLFGLARRVCRSRAQDRHRPELRRIRLRDAVRHSTSACRTS